MKEKIKSILLDENLCNKMGEDNTKVLINALHQKYQLYLLTSNKEFEPKEMYQNLDGIIYQERKNKQNPIFYKKLAQALQMLDMNVLYVDDDLVPLYTAQRANFSTCYYRDTMNDYFEFYPTMEVKHSKELIKQL